VPLESPGMLMVRDVYCEDFRFNGRSGGVSICSCFPITLGARLSRFPLNRRDPPRARLVEA